MDIPLDNELRLRGAEAPVLTLLRGEQWSTERTQELFHDAIWTFCPDGSFTLQPSPILRARGSLSPLKGTHRSRGALIEFHEEQENDLRTNASLDGFLSLRKEGYQVELIYSVGARQIVNIVQMLSPDLSSPAHLVRTGVGGFQVPSAFRFFLNGHVDGQTFGPLPGTLTVLPTSAADPNPCDVQCVTASLQEVGALSWLSFVRMEYGQSEVISRVLSDENGMRVVVEKGLYPLSPSWCALIPEELFADVQGLLPPGTGGRTIPVTAESGQLLLTIENHQLAGLVHAQGLSALGQSSRYEAHLAGQQIELEEARPAPLLAPQGSATLAAASFSGTWVSETFLQMQLEQEGTAVTGTYTGGGGGTMTGVAQGQVFCFTWQAGEVQAGEQGRGFLRMAASGRTLAGLWSSERGHATGHGIVAEIVQRPVPVLEEAVLHSERMEIKQRGYAYLRQGYYEQALPALKQALELYQVDIQQGGLALDAHLVDVLTLQHNLLQCYFELAGYEGVPATPDVVKEQATFYHELLEYLQGAVDSYRLFVRRILLSHTTRASDALAGPGKLLQTLYETLSDQATSLQHNTAEPRFERLLAIVDRVAAICSKLLAAREAINALGEHTPGKLPSIVQALTSLDDHLEQARQQALSEREHLHTLSVDWFTYQQEYVQGLFTFLLVSIEGQHTLITQAIRDAQERVPATWASAFDLSEWLERWRIRLSSDAAKIEALELGQAFFEKIIAFFVDMARDMEALVLSERARARAFADLLAARVSEQKSKEVHPARAMDLPITHDELLHIVHTRQSVILEYFFAETRLLIWTIRPSGELVASVSSADRAEVELMVQEFSALVQEKSYSDERQKRLSQILQRLYNALVLPVEGLLAGLANEEVVTIIPHGWLFLVPFSALIDGRGSHLIEKHALVLAPAIAPMEYTQRNAARVIHREQPDLLALVNPGENLPVAEQAFGEIARFYPGPGHTAIYRGRDAKKEVLWREASGYMVLCFVTHARACDERPLDSYLALAPTSTDDGQLRVPEIFQLELQADLVILGACETGRGMITGDGVNGLNRAFLAAGTPSLLMSLWEVGEEETIIQLSQFHEFWRGQALSKAEALRRTQIEALKDHPLQPDIWAGFVLIGEWM